MSTQVRERVLRSEVRPFGVTKLPFGLSAAELIAALLGVVLLVWSAAYYFSSLRPEQDKLRALEAELADQERIMIATPRPGDAAAQSPADRATEALETLDSFKFNYLKPFSSGRIALIKEINALAKKNSVTLTSGIDMGADPGESNAEGDQTSAKKDASKRKKADEILNAFPSVSFRFAVFGQYSNLRTFINQLEREKQFLVINSLNLANQEARTASRRARGEGVAGIVVTIEMSAYFQPAV